MILAQKSSTKRMIHSFSKTRDIDKIKFSHNQKYMLTIDTLHQTIKLWNVNKQQELYSFTLFSNSSDSKTIQNPHHMSFSSDDQSVIILGNKSIYVYNISSLINYNENVNKLNAGQGIQLKQVQQMNRIQGTTALGEGQASLDNLYYIYTNASQIQIRDLENFQLLQNYIDKKHYDQKDMKDQLCQPYHLIVSKYEKNVFYTSSDLNGKICKWSLKNKYNGLDKNYPVRFYPSLSISLNANINEIDQTDQLLIISHLKGRKVLALNKMNFQTVSQNLLKNLDDFLDINQKTISTYSYQKNIIISGVQKGQYLFYLNGTTLKTISRSKLQINTYALQYNQKSNFLAIGSQQRVNLANGSSQIYDQIFFYENKLNCGQIINTDEFEVSNGSTLFTNQCFCKDMYSWNRKTNQCLKLDCLIEEQNKNACSCNVYPMLTSQNNHKIAYQWNYYIQQCQLNCNTIQNTINRSSNFLPKNLNQCACKVGYRWNQNLFICQKVTCTLMQGSDGRLNKSLNLNSCGCNQKFTKSQKNPILLSNFIFQNQCILDCSQIQNSKSQKQSIFSSQTNKQFCQCNQNSQWNSTNYECLLKISFSSQSKQSIQNSKMPTISIILSILFILIIAIGIVAFCCYRKWKNNRQRKYQIESQTDTIGTNNDVVKSIKYRTNSEIKRQKQKQKEQLNIAINQQVARNNQPIFSKVQQSPIKNGNQVQIQSFIIDDDKKLNTSNSAVKKIIKNRKLNEFLNKINNDKNNLKDVNKQQNHLEQDQNQDELQSSRPIIIKQPLIQKKQQIKEQQKVQKQHFSKTCQLCFKKGCDCITRCQHYFHYACIKKQFEEDSNTTKQCPSCWTSLQNGLQDINKLFQEKIKDQVQKSQKNSQQ